MNEYAAALAKLESLVARMESALASVNRQPRTSVVSPARLTTEEACEKLRCSRTTLEGHAARGLLTQVRPKGRGRGKPVYYLPDEIDALAVSEITAAELMARKKRTRGIKE